MSVAICLWMHNLTKIYITRSQECDEVTSQYTQGTKKWCKHPKSFEKCQTGIFVPRNLCLYGVHNAMYTILYVQLFGQRIYYNILWMLSGSILDLSYNFI